MQSDNNHKTNNFYTLVKTVLISPYAFRFYRTVWFDRTQTRMVRWIHYKGCWFCDYHITTRICRTSRMQSDRYDLRILRYLLYSMQQMYKVQYETHAVSTSGVTQHLSTFNVECLCFCSTDDEVNAVCLMRMFQEWASISRNSSKFSYK
jgi:hypothetical protein